MLREPRGEPVDGHVCCVAAREERLEAVQHRLDVVGPGAGGWLPLRHREAKRGVLIDLPGLRRLRCCAHWRAPDDDFNPARDGGGLNGFLREEVRQGGAGGAPREGVDAHQGGQPGIGCQEVEEGEGGGGEGHVTSFPAPYCLS